ncbi:restriction endonuclease subunit S [Halomonas meridiana]|uniref:restriction endonuclease subunit S n=1 Tax=Vreelandella aquamarina TaxID=77097 RepID=UPI00273B40ED|nr:restriction endonuclease subunit S [Halomonas meridiana]MDP4557811.1 restriction endonuclease subunit S [Halomonas meridiana]
MSDQSWPATNLGELFTINTDGVAPNASPGTEFHHHSLPAWDEFGGPAVEKGSSIESNKTKVTKPCVLVSKLNPRKPRVSVVERVPEEEHHCASTEFVCLEPKSEEPLNFWGHLFSNKSFSDKLDRIAIGSTNSHKRYSPKALLSQRIELPPVTERRLIAHILDTLDTQIQQTEALIAKLEKVKEGLLHDLLTRGIDENGNLRPSPEQAPELYKESPLGLIPREWDLVKANQLCRLITKGTTPPSDQMSRAEDGIPFLRVEDLTFEGQVVLSSNTPKIQAHTHQGTLSRSICLPGDVLTNIVGPPLGKTGYVNEELGEVNINQAIAVFRPRPSILPDFLLLWLGSRLAKNWLAKGAKQTSGQLNLTLELCQALPIPNLLHNEQVRIVEKYSKVLKRVILEHESLKSLRDIKNGLMDDLLTGRVRVTPLLDQAQATTPA